MKPIKLVSKLFLLAAFFGVVVAAQAGERTKLYSCLINKSNSINIVEELGAPEGRRIVLERQNFLDDEGQPFVTLTHATVTTYGNVFMVLQDNGRSGYAFFRVERKEDGSYRGLMDVNLFRTAEDINTNGNLVELPCSAH